MDLDFGNFISHLSMLQTAYIRPSTGNSNQLDVNNSWSEDVHRMQDRSSGTPGTGIDDCRKSRNYFIISVNIPIYYFVFY